MKFCRTGVKTMDSSVNKYFVVRDTALNLLYKVPGYKEADLETKNFFYDAFRNRLMNLVEQQ